MTDALALADDLDFVADEIQRFPTPLHSAAAALRELHAENERLTARITAAEALIHDRTFGERLARDFAGNWFPQTVMMDDLRRALHPEEET